MRKTLLCGAAALGLSLSTAFAGGMAEPVMEPEVVAAASSSSGAGLLVPLLLLTLVAVAVSGSNEVPTCLVAC